MSKYVRFVPYLAALWLVIVAARVNYHYGPLPTTPSCWCLIYRVEAEDKAFEKVLQTIPQGASIAASGDVRAHLTHRENAFNLPHGIYTADYVAILDQDRVIGSYRPKPFETALIKDPVYLRTHQLVYQTGHFYLYRKVN